MHYVSTHMYSPNRTPIRGANHFSIIWYHFEIMERVLFIWKILKPQPILHSFFTIIHRKWLWVLKKKNVIDQCKK